MISVPKAEAQPPQAKSERLPWKVRWLGLLPLAFYAAHFWYYATEEFSSAHRGTDNMLWMCHVSNVTLAVGLLFDLKWLARLSVIWLIPGLPLWLLEVVVHGGWIATSFLTHIGGLIIGLVAMRWIRADGWSWLYALVWYLFIQQLTRMVTSNEYPYWNVNVAHAVYKGYENDLDYWLFWVITTLMATAGLRILWMILWKSFPPPGARASLYTVDAGLLGGVAGGWISFLLRPSLPGVGQLSLGIALTRGYKLNPTDTAKVAIAHASFDYMLAAAVLGVVIGIAMSYLVFRRKA
jgi:hypothetical protein